MTRAVPIDRRSLIATLAALAAAARRPAWAEAAAGDAGLISANVCRVAPELTEGPFYLDPDLVRSDITEGRPGMPLRLALQVVTADCDPVAGARVDVWQCDALGNYSGFARQGSDRVENTRGETFLRGTQATDAGGVARFETIWPGWYRGRTPHIHYKGFLDRATVLTSQIFFPDAVSALIFRSATPYDERVGRRDTTNAEDRIARRAGNGAFAEVRERSGGFDASLVVGIDPDERPGPIRGN
jgi:protocatechuate 3,4-dioxygenase beta subunit